jgi:hypothetical protein
MRTTFTTADFASCHALKRAQTITRKFGLAATGALSILLAARCLLLAACGGGGGASPLRAAEHVFCYGTDIAVAATTLQLTASLIR